MGRTGLENPDYRIRGLREQKINSRNSFTWFR
jgi:hypothetical protein